MRRAFFLVALAAALFAGSAASAQQLEQRAIDAAKSSAQFTIEHIWVDHVVGTLPIIGGTVAKPPDSAIPVTVSAELDPTRLKTGEGDRDASLESPDYFDTKQFPTWSFRSTKITPSGPNKFGLDGLLTMHGVTNPVHLDVTVTGDAAQPVYHATAQVDRRIWHMKGTRLDPVIGTVADVSLTIALK